MSFSQNFIYKVKSAGVLSLAQRYTTLKQISNTTWMGKCPNPEHQDSTPSFMVKQNSDGLESWSCFGCHSGIKGFDNYGSDNIAFMQWIYDKVYKSNLSFPEAVIKVAEFYNIELECNKYDYLYQANKVKAKAYSENLNSLALQYLKERGLDKEDIVKWRLGFDGKRIVFPILDCYNQIIGFSRRILQETKDEPKYINSVNSQIFKKQNIFYGIQFVNHKEPKLLIVEGQMDAILAHKYNVPYTVATMSCSLSDYHANYIKENNKIPIICYDGDDAGKNGMLKAINKLNDFKVPNVKILILPRNMDLADMALKLKKDLPKYVENHIMPYSTYFLQNIANELDTTMNNKIMEIAPRIRQIINNIRDPDEKHMAQNFIEKRIKLWAA